MVPLPAQVLAAVAGGAEVTRYSYSEGRVYGY